MKGEAVAPGEAGWPRRWVVFNTTCGGVNQKNEVEQTRVAEFLFDCLTFENGSLSTRCSGHNLLSDAI